VLQRTNPIERVGHPPKTKNGCKEYSIPIGMKLLFSIAIPGMLYGSIVNFVTKPEERWVSMLLIAMAAFCAYFLPATILFSTEQIISIRWYGIKRTTMDWHDVTVVYFDPAQNSIVVRDKFENTIMHTTYNVDRSGFIEQIESLPVRTLEHIHLQINT